MLSNVDGTLAHYARVDGLTLLASRVKRFIVGDTLHFESRTADVVGASFRRRTALQTTARFC